MVQPSSSLSSPSYIGPGYPPGYPSLYSNSYGSQPSLGSAATLPQQPYSDPSGGQPQSALVSAAPQPSSTPPATVNPLQVSQSTTGPTHHHSALTHHKPLDPEAQAAFLNHFSFTVLIDRSKSMNEDVEEGTSRWVDARESVGLIVAEAEKYDKKGIDVCFFGSQTEWKHNVETVKKVKDIFHATQPSGGTNLTKALEETFATHFERKKHHHHQHSIILVITDGEPDDQQSVQDAIIHCTRKISQDRIFNYHHKKKTLEIGIRFFQVGNDDDAKEFLEALHTKLSRQGAHADICDTGFLSDLHGANGVREAFIHTIFN